MEKNWFRLSVLLLRPDYCSVTLLIMIFKELLTETGVITSLPEFFSALPIPTFLVFVLLFLFGTIVAGTQAIIVLCMPMAMEVITPGHTGLALFTLLMCIGYVAMQISPTHICLVLARKITNLTGKHDT